MFNRGLFKKLSIVQGGAYGNGLTFADESIENSGVHTEGSRAVRVWAHQGAEYFMQLSAKPTGPRPYAATCSYQ